MKPMRNDNLFSTYFLRRPAFVLAMLAFGALLGGLASPVRASSFDSVDGSEPAGRVGRIASLAGTVTLFNRQSGESFSAPLNQPLTSGDVLRSEPGARAEIEIGSVTVRLDAQSELELTRIDDERIQLSLNDGRAMVRLATRDTLNEFALSSREARFFARDTGVYRFDTDSQSTVATVYAGSLQAESGRNVFDIPVGQSAQFWFDDDRGEAQHRLLAAVDDNFTQWSEARDRLTGWPEGAVGTGHAARSAYTNYVSPEMTGAADLDAYGDWSETPEYGAVWLPRRVSPDWAPYRDGRWVWVQPWGWNWVGNEPWGFAPYHYGRWLRYRGAWAWVPGARVVRPVYSPAMVAWVGASGASLSFSFSVNSRPGPDVNWFPLAPHEVYVPAFRSTPRYVRSVNQPHVTRIDNVSIIANRPQDAMRYGAHENRRWSQAGGRAPVESARLRPRLTPDDGPRFVAGHPAGSFAREIHAARVVPAPLPVVRQPREARRDVRVATVHEPNTSRIGQPATRSGRDAPAHAQRQVDLLPDAMKAPISRQPAAQPGRHRSRSEARAAPVVRERDPGERQRGQDDEDWRRKHPRKNAKNAQ